MGCSPKRARASGGSAEEQHGVGSGGHLRVAGQLEQVGKRQAEAKEALLDVDEDHEAADDRRVAEPAVGVESHAGERIVGHLGEAAGPRVGRRVEDQRRVHEHAGHERDVVEQGAVVGRHGPLPRRDDDAELGAGMHLAVDEGVRAGDVLGHVAIEVAHERRERLEARR